MRGKYLLVFSEEDSVTYMCVFSYFLAKCVSPSLIVVSYTKERWRIKMPIVEMCFYE